MFSRKPSVTREDSAMGNLNSGNFISRLSSQLMEKRFGSRILETKRADRDKLRSFTLLKLYRSFFRPTRWQLWPGLRVTLTTILSLVYIRRKRSSQSRNLSALESGACF